MKKALVVIDVQNYFYRENTKDTPAKIAEYIEKNIKKFDFVVFQKFINHTNTPFYKMGWKDMMGPPETDFCSEIQNIKHIEFSRSTRSCLRDEKFKRFLEENNVTELFLCGFNTDECVISTAFDASDLGYCINVIEKLCATYNGNDFHNSAMKLMNEQFKII